MQTASLKIWTLVDNSISYNDNHDTTSASYTTYMNTHIYVYVYIKDLNRF